MAEPKPEADRNKTRKEQLVDLVPKRFKGVRFGIQSSQDIVNQAVLEVSDRILYDVEKKRAPFRHGPLDPRLGTSNKIAKCETCHEPLATCTGHFGHVRLPLPVFHIGYLGFVVSILQNICKKCSSILLTETERRKFLKELRRAEGDSMKRTSICKKINETCKKTKLCPKCGSENGIVKKSGPLKVVHDKWSAYNRSTAAKKKMPETKIEFEKSFAVAKKLNPEVGKHMRKALEDLNPLIVMNLFKLMNSADCELVGLNSKEGRPEMFLWEYIPAPPVCIRPSVAQEAASTEDDLTTKLAEIVQISGLIRASLQKGSPIATIMELWEYLQLQIGMYVNSDVPGLSQPGFGKSIRGFCQRLKGKQGRFRGNLSGKRVDFSGRTVISPDPNLSIDEVGIPLLVAKILTFPEQVNHVNIGKLRECVRRGSDEWPGATYVTSNKPDESSYKMNLKFGNKRRMAEELKVGDMVERHLEDGDVVLFNRQPSLHKLSIMAHRVKVLPWRTFRLNECVCGPYNADFDGDEMNIHVPQTEEARAEALTLMGVKHNLVTPKNGEPIIAAIQDFITAAYLISSKDRFYTRQAFTYICMHMTQARVALDLPPPAIVKPQALWTGKQVFNVMMRPNLKSPVKVNLDAKCKQQSRAANMPDMDAEDGYLVIRNSEVMSGRMDKSTIGSGKKSSVFYVILRDYGPDEAVAAMNRLAKLCSRFLGNHGFSVGLFDVFPPQALRVKKEALIEQANKDSDGLVRQFQSGKLKRLPGCDLDQSLENRISGLLSVVRTDAGTECFRTLSPKNAPLTMSNSGSKGSELNVAQMVAVVGQQMISGARVPDGFFHRSIFHFDKLSRQPAAKGFVKNSFYTGLSPSEFVCHAISGREGLVDTAVKTAETGYMSRRLMKALEDLDTRYDDTVRNSNGGIVQFQYGGDQLDPVDMEGSAQPVNFDRTWSHAENITWSNSEPSLSPEEIRGICDSMLQPHQAKLERRDLVTKELMGYWDDSWAAVDHLESARKFIRDVKLYVEQRACKLEKLVGGGDDGELDPSMVARIDKLAKVSRRTLETFVKMCLEKHQKARVEPGSAVGAVGAQSIGEPGTQMTLKTFHFAGIGSAVSITQGVPRIKEIVDASNKISTPIITCRLENNKQEEAARIVKGRIEKMYISDVLKSIDGGWNGAEGVVVLVIDRQSLKDLHLNITLKEIAHCILAHKKWKIRSDDIHYHRRTGVIAVNVHLDNSARRGAKKVKEPATMTEQETGDLMRRVNFLARDLPTLPISGYPEAQRAVIQQDDKGEYDVCVEGSGLRDCMNTDGVVGTATKTNHVMETWRVLGIEAGRQTIIREIQEVMQQMDIDPRHMDLLADVMTYRGEVLGNTRFGLAKTRDSVLHLASFEKTPDHLFNAAAGMKTDFIEGVSESIIMGQTMSVGTGSFSMVRRLGLSAELLKPRPTVFEDVWRAEEKWRKKKGIGW